MLISITDSAKRFISERYDGKLLSVEINNKGCSGNSYVYKQAEFSDVEKYDEIVRFDNSGLLIKSNSIIKLIGSTLDLSESILESKLVWINPNAINLCGCGESFST